MPGTAYTPFNPGGQSYVPEVERFNAQRAAQMAALSQQGQIAGAEIADRGAGRDWQAGQSALDRTQQANIAGTFGQRSAQDMQMEQLRQGGQMDIAKLNDTGMTERANIGITPQMANIGLQGRMYGDTRADTADERGLKHSMFQELTGGGGNPMASSASIDALKSAAGGDPAVRDYAQRHHATCAASPLSWSWLAIGFGSPTLSKLVAKWSCQKSTSFSWSG
jgi:hypothetical protein